jgi:hypothetical protein
MATVDLTPDEIHLLRRRLIDQAEGPGFGLPVHKQLSDKLIQAQQTGTTTVRLCGREWKDWDAAISDRAREYFRMRSEGELTGVFGILEFLGMTGAEFNCWVHGGPVADRVKRVWSR